MNTTAQPLRALTLTQPWAGLVASGIKLVENRPRTIIKREDFGKPFAIHASREIDKLVYSRIYEIAPELRPELAITRDLSRWHALSRITSAIIGVATIDKVLTGWDATTIAEHAADLCDSSGELLGPNQVRWFFGPVGYVLRDVRPLLNPCPIKGALGFWTVPEDVRANVTAEIARCATCGFTPNCLCGGIL